MISTISKSDLGRQWFFQKLVILTFSFLSSFLIGCGRPSSDSNETSANFSQDKIDVIFKNNKSITESIKNYYITTYGNGVRFKEISNDTITHLKIYQPDSINGYEWVLMSVIIPLTGNQELYGAKPILYGDVNSDGNNDFIISVHTEEGGVIGGNVYWQDIFVFLAKNGDYILTSVTSDSAICDCYGLFRARKIEGAFVMGILTCYADHDAHCCPSLDYIAKVEFKNNKLIIKSQKKYQLIRPS